MNCGFHATSMKLNRAIFLSWVSCGKISDINYRDEYGKSPLHHATSGKHHNIVELLLARGADVTLQDQRGDTPLHAAVRAGDESSVKVGIMVTLRVRGNQHVLLRIK